MSTEKIYRFRVEDNVTIIAEFDGTRPMPKSSGSKGGGTGISTSFTNENEDLEPISETEQEKPYINGYSDGAFKPDNNITRAEMAQIIANLLSSGENIDLSVIAPFSDIPAVHWGNNALAFVISKGYMQGDADGKFRPDEYISRAELVQVLQNLGIAVLTGTPLEFTDIAGHWAVDVINGMSASGIISGYSDGSFKPDNSVTRAEAVAMLSRLFKRSEDWAGTKTFADVSSYHWAYKHIMNAVNGK